MVEKMNVVIRCGTSNVKTESNNLVQTLQDCKMAVSQKTAIGIANNVISNYMSQLFAPLLKNFNGTGYEIINNMLDNIKIGNYVPFRDYKEIFKEVIKLEIKTVCTMHGVDFSTVDRNQINEIDKIITNLCNDLIKII